MLFNCRSWSGHRQIVIALLILSAFESALAQNYAARTRQEITVDDGEQLGLHQLNANTALLVSGVGSSFGIYRYNLANDRRELLKAIVPRPLPEHLFGPDGPAFHTIDKLTFIDIGGRLYSTDGTVENTQFIRDFGVQFGGGNLAPFEESKIRRAHRTGKQLLLSTNTSRVTDTGRFEVLKDLFISDGSPAGTQKIGSDFARVSVMFSINNETFFLGKKSETDNIQIWQVIENGTRLSKVLTTTLAEGGPISLSLGRRGLVVSGDTAYFCLGNQLASFSNKRLNLTPTVVCGIEEGSGQHSFFEVNSSGVFIEQEGIFKLNTQTLEASIIDISSVSNQPASIDIGCSTDDSLIFVLAEGDIGNQRFSLLSYNATSGLQHTGIVYRSGIVCLNDRVIVPTENGFSIYKSDLNGLQPIRRTSNQLLDFTLNNEFNQFDDHTSISVGDKIYSLSRTYDNSPITRIVEISERGPLPNMAPIISELLLEREKPGR